MNFVGHRGGYRPRALLRTEKIFSQADARTSVAVTGPTSLNASHEKKRESERLEKKERDREREIEGEAERRRARKSRGEMGQANEWVE